MDKVFQKISDMYLSQNFVNDDNDDRQIAGCRNIAGSYAMTENAVVSMGDNKLNCSYCYFGGLADELGLTDEERKDVIPSLYEDFIFDRADRNDLAHRHADEVAFIHMLKTVAMNEKRDYFLSDFLRMRDKNGKERLIEHRMFPMAISSNGSLRLMACVYTIARGNDRIAKIVNTRSGEIRVLTNKDYEKVLTCREREVLSLIDKGMLSKEIAIKLSISINTVNRHRQNLLEKLKVDHAIEACRIARAMGLL